MNKYNANELRIDNDLFELNMHQFIIQIWDLDEQSRSIFHKLQCKKDKIKVGVILVDQLFE